MKSKEDIIGHQVNAKGVMGAGVAKLIKDTYPIVYKRYKAACDLIKPESLLGQCQVIWYDRRKGVANLFGQLDYGRSSKRYTDYEALRKALVELKRIAVTNEMSVALPYTKHWLRFSER